ncbi:unnamed protein product [Bathycoccus prasinos]
MLISVPSFSSLSSTTRAAAVGPVTFPASKDSSLTVFDTVNFKAFTGTGSNSGAEPSSGIGPMTPSIQPTA